MFLFGILPTCEMMNRFVIANLAVTANDKTIIEATESSWVLFWKNAKVYMVK
jgi:hypothetical protein